MQETVLCLHGTASAWAVSIHQDSQPLLSLLRAASPHADATIMFTHGIALSTSGAARPDIFLLPFQS